MNERNEKLLIKGKGSQVQVKSGLTIYVPISPAKTTEVYDSYWKFAALRQEAFFNRLSGNPYPWSSDSIINQHRFTNVYRAADRVSQYLIKNVIYRADLPDNPKEILFRILLFKLFNKIDTWELLNAKLGPITYEEYDFRRYDDILTKAITTGKRIYSAAYIMPSGKSYYGHIRKHSNHLKLIEHLLKQNTHEHLMSVKRMQQAFEIIKSFPSLGDFLAYQLLIDINYSTLINFSESEFVVAGPGAKGGISKCFFDTAGLSNVEIIKLMTDRQEQEFERLGLSFKNLWGRPLQLIDCQNIFCEVDKYARVKHPDIKGNSERIKIKQKFKINPKPLSFWFPPKWNLNDKIADVKDNSLELFKI
ncbi:nucleotide kinase domain-containing protein [Runella zeae]|uniref:nucleotide kinase domain-containing protein n=1 Tax=Runella zeae TaxID=94255 RepID=UPI002355649E|nr:nucleotide kinase domain-containing protein [Runella zeae]